MSYGLSANDLVKILSFDGQGQGTKKLAEKLSRIGCEASRATFLFTNSAEGQASSYIAILCAVSFPPGETTDHHAEVVGGTNQRQPA